MRGRETAGAERKAACLPQLKHFAVSGRKASKFRLMKISPSLLQNIATSANLLFLLAICVTKGAAAFSSSRGEQRGVSQRAGSRGCSAAGAAACRGRSRGQIASRPDPTHAT